MVKSKRHIGATGGGGSTTTTKRTSAPTPKKPVARTTKARVAVRKMRKPLRKRRKC